MSCHVSHYLNYEFSFKYQNDCHYITHYYFFVEFVNKIYLNLNAYYKEKNYVSTSKFYLLVLLDPCYLPSLCIR